MKPQTSGIPTLDPVLRGGWLQGDNVVWVSAEADDLAAICTSFLNPPAPLKRLVAFDARRRDDLLSNVDDASEWDVLDQSSASPRQPLADLMPQILDGVGPWARVVIDGLDDIRAIWGVRAAADFHRRVCPHLLDRGSIAYWTSTRRRASSTLIDQVTRVSQCVIDLRDDRLRIVKAEGRPSRVQGGVFDLTRIDGIPEIGREHSVGRVGEGLRQLRRDRNLTQSEVAKLAGVTPAAISQAETGRRGLSLETMIGLSDAVGIKIDDLLGNASTSDLTLVRHDQDEPAHGMSGLIDDSISGVRSAVVRLEPDQRGHPPVAHYGPEQVFVSRGLVLIEGVDNSPVLRAGDALLASGAPIRSWLNLADGESELFWTAVHGGGAGTGDTLVDRR